MKRQRLFKGEKRQFDWDNLAKDLIDNCDKYHQYFYKQDKFNGPSHHFHIRALNASENEKSELIYALLVSWGMHRMGGGAQMNDFEIFSNSLTPCTSFLQDYKTKNIEEISDKEFDQLKKVFELLDPMHSKPKIVANSKILAHYLPNLIAPVDNEYTFKFISQESYKPRNWNEFELFKEIHLKLIKVVISNGNFKIATENWINNLDYCWDTSYPKIVDNLIIGKIGDQKDKIKKKKELNPT